MWEFEHSALLGGLFRTGAMQAMLTNYTTLEVTMEEASHRTDDCSRCSSGVAALMEKFQRSLD